MVKTFFQYITIASLSISLSTAQSIRINEVAASNSTFQDEDGDTPDWIELYNYGTTEVLLAGMTLTDNPDEADKWALPNMALAPDSYLVVFASDKDRIAESAYRTLIDQGDEYQYLIPDREIGYTWLDINYDDSTWTAGDSGFGYGDNDDVTIVPSGTQSIYLRKIFSISDPRDVQDLLLDIDYDDGFRAYINGEFVCGNNIQGTTPAYDASATTDHEALIYQGEKPERYEIANPSTLLQTNNILCIQVHNKTNTSSDLTLIPILTAYTENLNDGKIPPLFLEYSQQPLHTNFKISSSGETIALYNSTGSLIDSLATTNLASDLSIGVSPSNPGNPSYFATPTPGSPNATESFIGILEGEVNFSKESGQTEAFSLTLSGAETNETIRYTLDGSLPTSAATSYTGPITISDISVVRARIFKPGYLPSKTESKSYLIGIDHELPIISIVVDPIDMFSEEEGIYSYGNDYSTDFPYYGANFWKDQEKAMNISFYNNSGAYEYGLDGGIKIFGGFSRAWDQRSLSIFARKKYGNDKIAYPVFKDLEYDSFNSIVLRNAGNDWTYTNIRDGFMTTLMSDSGLETQAFQPYVTYINGEYWGIYNAREKINEHFLAAKSGAKKKDIDFLELKGIVKHGSNEDYLEMYSFIEQNDLSSPEKYQLISSQIDIDNYILYYVAQVYYGNRDWPGNNLKYWREEGGKWRWILFDTEIGFGMWEVERYMDNTLAAVLDDNGPAWPNPPWSTLIMRKLMQNETFKKKFVNRFADEMNSRFLTENVKNHIDSIKSIIESEVPAHFDRWDGSPGNWNSEIRHLNTYSDNRALEVKQHILTELDLPAYHEIYIVNPESERGFVKINNRLKITQEQWRGDYFEKVPFSLTAIASEGYKFSHWEQGSSSTDSLIYLDLKANTTIQPKFVNDGTANTNRVINPVVKVYPNPTTEILNIKISDFKIRGAFLSLIDEKGIVHKTLLNNSNISSDLELKENISALPSGVYFLELSGQQFETQSIKVIKN